MAAWKEYIFEENEKGINFDSILPDLPEQVLWNGEWIDSIELVELFAGSSSTPYVAGLKDQFDEYVIGGIASFPQRQAADREGKSE